MTDPGACIVTTSTFSAQSSGGRDVTSSYRWLSYVAEQGILRDIAVDAAGKPLPFDSPANTSAYTKLDADGRVLVRAVEAGGGALQRSDFRRDSHGNVMSYREVHTARRNLDAPSPEEPGVAYDFVNHYSSSGLLEKHNRADSSASIDYRHDAQGRCQLIVSSDQFEHRDYDESGRLGAQLFGPMAPDAAVDLASPSSITTHRYDDQGRPLAVEQDGGGPGALPVDGEPDIQALWSYDDGGWQIESIDFTSDTPNDSIERNGTMVSALHRSEAWSAGCAALQSSMPLPTGNACVAD